MDERITLTMVNTLHDEITDLKVLVAKLEKQLDNHEMIINELRSKGVTNEIN